MEPADSPTGMLPCQLAVSPFAVLVTVTVYTYVPGAGKDTSPMATRNAPVVFACPATAADGLPSAVAAICTAEFANTTWAVYCDATPPPVNWATSSVPQL